MKPSEQQPRINLTELKTQIVKKVGLERSRQYFYSLNSLFSQKLSKSEFDKICLRILGRENLPLHNQLIRSILKNVCHAKVPPSVHLEEVPKSTTELLGKKNQSPSGEGGHNNPNGRPSPVLIPTPGVSTPPLWSNGDILPMSPRKGRSGIRDRRLKDRPSPLGPNGKTDISSHQLNAIANDGNVKVKFTENGGLKSCDFQRPLQHHQGHAQQPENERDVSLPCSTVRSQIKNSVLDPGSVHSKGPVVDAPVTNNRGGIELAGESQSTRSPLLAPLGIQFSSPSIGGARRISAAENRSSFVSSVDSEELCDTETLNKRMEQIARARGLEGVSVNCANLLNNGLDVYLKRLIRSCVELVGTSFGHEPPKQPVFNYKQQPHGKLINGIRPGHQLHMQSSSGATEGMQDARTQTPISLLNFKVAMELNPQQLGEDWPSLLEKICMHASEE